jgi:hypothetical protein
MHACMGTLTYTARKRMEDERLVKDLCEGSIKHLMDQPVSDTSFADITLLGIKHMEVLITTVLITQCNEIFVQLEDEVLYVSLKILNIFSLPLASFKILPSKEQVLDRNHVIKQITRYFHASKTFCA